MLSNFAKGQPAFRYWNPAVVDVGGIPLGGNHTVRIQSMTNTPTMDTAATVAQCIRLIEAGCELVRITAQNTREAENLAVIKKALQNAGFNTPIIADVHFKPAIAELAARFVEKVRINPGNYADKRSPGKSFSEHSYQEELEKIAQRIDPLLKICKNHGTALRIGTNHGSLSWRIMERYGDTPEGMAESAMEFVRICNAAGFYKLVLSMKSSNVRVMVEATRLLVHKMMQENMQYPVHLGVTEAGNALEGRMKSAAGIGALLADGIGDTIRVSLTEAPENEIPVARQIADFFPKGKKTEFIQPESAGIYELQNFTYTRRITKPAGTIGNGNLPVVLSDHNGLCTVNEFVQPEGNQGEWDCLNLKETGHIHYKRLDPLSDKLFDELLNQDETARNTALVFNVTGAASIQKIRQRIGEMDGTGKNFPVLLSCESHEPDFQRFAVDATLKTAPLLVEGWCDGIYLNNSHFGSDEKIKIAFKILQATRARITENDYIACPGCGRTQYDLEESLEKVKWATAHLKGLKIAVMGCIVNGPGEMADADFGYVGQGNGKVSIYKGRLLVKKDVPEKEAVKELVAVMKAQGH